MFTLWALFYCEFLYISLYEDIYGIVVKATSPQVSHNGLWPLTTILWPLCDKKAKWSLTGHQLVHEQSATSLWLVTSAESGLQPPCDHFGHKEAFGAASATSLWPKWSLSDQPFYSTVFFFNFNSFPIICCFGLKEVAAFWSQGNLKMVSNGPNWGLTSQRLLTLCCHQVISTKELQCTRVLKSNACRFLNNALFPLLNWVEWAHSLSLLRAQLAIVWPFCRKVVRKWSRDIASHSVTGALVIALTKMP